VPWHFMTMETLFCNRLQATVDNGFSQVSSPYYYYYPISSVVEEKTYADG